MQYFKPNFSHHPLNYVFIFLIFLGSFAFSSMALAFDDDGSWQDGKFYYYEGAHYTVTAFRPTQMTACEVWGGTSVVPVSSGGNLLHYCYRDNGQSKRIVQGDCATNSQVANSPEVTTHGCGTSPDPVNNCPEFGTVKRVSKLVNGTLSNGVFTPHDTNSVTTLEIGGGGVVDGCGYAVPVGENAVGFDSAKSHSCKWSGEAESRVMMCYRFENMIATGELASVISGSPSADISDSENPIEDGAAKSQLETTSDKVIGDVTVTDMAGTSSATQTITETLVKDKGAVVVDSQETAVITESNGIYRTVTTTTNTLDFPDGTQQVITETNTAYTQTPKTIFNIDKSTGTTNITVQGGSSADYSVTETKDYDAEGNETGSKTEESGSGDGEAEEEKEAQECEADPEKCKETEFAKTEKGSFDLVAAATAMGDAEGEYIEYIEIVKGEVEQKIGIQFSGGSGSIDSNVINVRGATGDIGLTKWIPFLDDFGLAALIMFLAAMYSAYILLGGNRD